MNIIFKVILILLIIIMSILTYSTFDEEASVHVEISGHDQKDDDDDIPSRLVKVEGQVAIRLDTVLQKQNGIETQLIKAMKIYTEFDAFGRVLNIDALLTFSANVNELNAEKNIILSELSAANKKMNRLKILHQEATNISTKQLQEAEADSNIWQIKLAALNSQLADIRARGEQTWGTVLSSWVLDKTDAFAKILSGEELILFVALRSNDTLPENIQSIYISRNGNRSSAQTAHYISPAIESDHVLQGETYYFQVDASQDQYRADMHVHVWVPQSTEPIIGTFIPESAVVWSSGKAWVYVKKESDIFIKRVINNPVALRDGMFVEKDLAVGDAVVSSGAQMLLAEEYRWSIPDEDNNP